jgi:hypothetical protein
MDIRRGVIKKSLFIILPAAVISAFFEWKRLPVGIIAGGVIGILNLQGITQGVKGFIESQRATAVVILLNMTRLFLLGLIIFILIWFKIINVLGMLFGFTVVIVLILIEGLKAERSKNI